MAILLQTPTVASAAAGAMLSPRTLSSTPEASLSSSSSYLIPLRTATSASSLPAAASLRLSSFRKSSKFSGKPISEGLDGTRSNKSPRGSGCLVRCAVALEERSYGAVVVQGSKRDTLEDTVSVAVDSKGAGPSFFGVFDGHGGNAVAELLRSGFWSVYKDKLSGEDPEKATTSAYLAFDQQTLAQPKGLFGALRERGVGGARCGATAATAVLLPSKDGKKILVVANVGDARAVLSRAGQAIQLTVDHKPEIEAERKRIESRNPTPKKPLVVNVEGTWRVGGLLNLSRSFGDVYLKDWAAGGSSSARGGFGLTAEPHVTVETLVPEDEFVILATDGLWDHVPNDEAADFVRSAGKDKPLEDSIKELIKVAQERGSTDDISIVIVRPLEVPGYTLE